MCYIGKVLCEFCDSGKLVFVVGENYSQGQYYFVSFVNKIWFFLQGQVDFYGFVMNGLYYKMLLDKLKVFIYVFWVGIYKFVVELFICDDMLFVVCEVDSCWIGELW